MAEGAIADGPIPGVRRIAVLRANAIGDYVMVLPALDALRAAYPRAELVLLGKEWHRGFLEGRASPVDRVEVVPPVRGVGADEAHQPNEAERAAADVFLQRMRENAFDLALQLHGGGRYSNPFLKSIGARITAGLRTPDAVPLDRCVPYRYYQNEVMRYLEVVRMVGAIPVGFEPRLAPGADDLREADRLLRELGWTEGRRLAVLHPGARDPRRRWPEAKFAAVASALAAPQLRVLVIGDAQEAALAESVASMSGDAATSVAGRLSVGGLLGLIARADLAVCNDSGPHHLALALGTPTVGVFWAGNLINAGPLTRTRHRVVLSWRMRCPVCEVDCTTGRCGHRASFVADARVDEVMAEALDLLATTGGNRNC